MHIETLEPRRLRSATVEQTFPGYYEIAGDESDDVIVVNVDQDQATFTLDGVTYSGVSYIYVYGKGGNDSIDVSAPTPGSIGASIDGGDGNDHLALNFDGGIWAGAGDDTIDLRDSFQGEVYGEGGSDQVYVLGECVDPEIQGGDGNDLIDASQNNYGVVIRGGAGNDTIYGSEYADQIYGDAGADRIYGLGGNDTFYCRDGEADTVFGGGGTDFLYADGADVQNNGVEYVFYG